MKEQTAVVALVIVFLPTSGGQLVFCHREVDEAYWSATFHFRNINWMKVDSKVGESQEPPFTPFEWLR